MRIANMIICHQYPELVGRIIKVMQHPGCDFFVHVDKKVSIHPFLYLEGLPQTKLVEDRKIVRWGGYSQLEAIGATLGEIIASRKQYDFINLMSGQDYPIKPIDTIHDFFNSHIGWSFLSSETPPTPWWDIATRRFSRYHLTDYGFRGKDRLAKWINSVLPQRDFPLPFTLYGGPLASYWTISYEAALLLWTFLKRRDFKWLFFKHTWGADEFLVNTILMNSSLRDKVINNNYRYFDRLQGNSHPDILLSADFLTLQASDKFFARKFDPTVDAQILDQIDKFILRCRE